MSENKQYENEYKVQAVKLAKKIGAVKAAQQILDILILICYNTLETVGEQSRTFSIFRVHAFRRACPHAHSSTRRKKYTYAGIKRHSKRLSGG